MSAGAVIAMRRKRLVKRFRDAGAIDREHAVTVESLGERRSWVFQQMMRHGVFRAAEADRVYLDEETAGRFLHERRLRAWTLMAVLVLVFVVLWAVGLLGN
jgi:hypothetical protein